MSAYRCVGCFGANIKWIDDTLIQFGVTPIARQHSAFKDVLLTYSGETGTLSSGPESDDNAASKVAFEVFAFVRCFWLFILSLLSKCLTWNTLWPLCALRRQKKPPKIPSDAESKQHMWLIVLQVWLWRINPFLCTSPCVRVYNLLNWYNFHFWFFPVSRCARRVLCALNVGECRQKRKTDSGILDFAVLDTRLQLACSCWFIVWSICGVYYL